MSKPLVLITSHQLPQPGIDLLKMSFSLIYCDASNDYDNVKEKCLGVYGIMWIGSRKLDANIIDAAGPSLKIVVSYLNDYDNIDTELLKQRNIYFATTSVIVSESIADMGLTLLLACARRIKESRSVVYANDWKSSGDKRLLGIDIRGSICGFYGYNDVSELIKRRLKPFDIKEFIYTSTTTVGKTEDIEEELLPKEVSFNQLLEKSDIIFITTELKSSTTNKFNQAAFQRMKKTSILINLFKPKIIDQAALYDALKNKKIFAAGLDRLVEEPCFPEEPLFKLLNCIITPNISTATIRTREDMAIVASHNMIQALGKHPIFI